MQEEIRYSAKYKLVKVEESFTDEEMNVLVQFKNGIDEITNLMGKQLANISIKNLNILSAFNPRDPITLTVELFTRLENGEIFPKDICRFRHETIKPESSFTPYEIHQFNNLKFILDWISEEMSRLLFGLILNNTNIIEFLNEDGPIFTLKLEVVLTRLEELNVPNS